MKAGKVLENMLIKSFFSQIFFSEFNIWSSKNMTSTILQIVSNYVYFPQNLNPVISFWAYKTKCKKNNNSKYSHRLIGKKVKGNCGIVLVIGKGEDGHIGRYYIMRTNNTDIFCLYHLL